MKVKLQKTKQQPTAYGYQCNFIELELWFIPKLVQSARLVTWINYLLSNDIQKKKRSAVDMTSSFIRLSYIHTTDSFISELILNEKKNIPMLKISSVMRRKHRKKTELCLEITLWRCFFSVFRLSISNIPYHKSNHPINYNIWRSTIQSFKVLITHTDVTQRTKAQRSK